MPTRTGSRCVLAAAGLATGVALGGCADRDVPLFESQARVLERAHAPLPPTRSMAAEPSTTAYVPCPAPADDLDAILDEAGRRYDGADFAVALACTELATDLAPEAVEAHHLRAAAFAAIERFPEAQLGFAMALALDPDDP